MSSKQTIFFWATGTNNPDNVTLLNGNLGGSSQLISDCVVADFTITNIFIKVSVAPGAGTSRVWTLHKNDSTTGVAVTIADAATTGQYTGSSVSYTAGDTIRLVRSITGSPAAANTQGTAELTIATANAQIIGFSTGTNADTNGEIYPGINGIRGGTAADFPFASQIPSDGTITTLRARVRTAPGIGGSGKARTFKYVLDGVTQDGTSGTPDTTCTVSETATQASSSFTLPVTAGQSLSIVQNLVSSPAAITWVNAYGLYVVSGHPISTGMTFNPCNAAANSFGYPVTCDNTATDASAENLTGGLSTIKFKTLRVKISAATGGGKTRKFTLNVNGSDTGLTLTIANPDVTGLVSVNPAISITSTDVFTIACVPTGGPNAADARVTLTEELQANPSKGGKGGRKGAGPVGVNNFNSNNFIQFRAINEYGSS